MKFAVFAFALLITAPAFAGGEPADVSACASGAVGAMQRRYENMKDLSADFVQESRSVALGGPGQTSRSEGHVVFAKPGRMRWTYTSPEESLVVSDGESLWIYDPAAGEAQKLPVGDGALSAAGVQFLLGEGDVLTQFAIVELACDAERAWLELIPREPAAYEKLRVTLNPRSGDMRETEVTDVFGNVTRVSFENMRVDTSPGAQVFQFEAPDGVEVIELQAPPS